MKQKKLSLDILAKRVPDALFYVSFSNRKPALVSVPERVLAQYGFDAIQAGICTVYRRDGMYVISVVKFDPEKQTPPSATKPA